MRLRAAAVLVVGLASLALAGCATTGPFAPGADQRLSPRDHVSRAIERLSAGDRDAARADLTAALAAQPKNAAARKLLDQIDKEPATLLGSRSYPYRVKPGESLSMLAERFLGDPLLFYALARYNGIDAPQSTRAGQVLRIPGAPPKPAEAPRPATPPPAIAAIPRDAERASQLRGAALEQLSGGAVERAVSLLQQAQALDPDNALIRRDLDRASRIRTAMRRPS